MNDKEIEILEKLTTYGTVKTCKIIKDQIVTIVLTGSSDNAMKSFKFMADCQESFPEYPKMETCVIEKDLSIIVLTK